VDLTNAVAFCDCPDRQDRHRICKHLAAVDSVPARLSGIGTAIALCHWCVLELMVVTYATLPLTPRYYG
jgi:hypothetical protein